jgi:hypothetical protein
MRYRRDREYSLEVNNRMRLPFPSSIADTVDAADSVVAVCVARSRRRRRQLSGRERVQVHVHLQRHAARLLHDPRCYAALVHRPSRQGLLTHSV